MAQAWTWDHVQSENRAGAEAWPGLWSWLVKAAGGAHRWRNTLAGQPQYMLAVLTHVLAPFEQRSARSK